MKDDKVVKIPTSAGLRTLGEGSLILILYLFNLCAAVIEAYIKVGYKRGISQGDMIDLNRENIKGFDVREFYVDVVSGLKAKGL